MSTPPIIAIDHFSYRYPRRDRPALRDVSLRVGSGELLAISGPSGCGKSTLALAMGGYLWQRQGGSSSGTVRVGGANVQQQPLYETADHVAVVQQNPEAQFCTLTVEDEVAFGLENRRAPVERIERQVAWALDQVGAAHLRHRELATLSGGEAQRVAIAALLAAEPRVLILDEPTSSLDPSATRDILALLSRLRAESGLTTIVIEHKLQALRPLHPRLISMDAGRIVAQGQGIPTPIPLIPRRPAPPGEVAVRLQGVRVAYDGATALGPLDVSLHRGQLIALMGDNGSGKSTALRAIMGLQPLAAGRITSLGRDVSRTPVHQLAAQAGMVFQNPDHQLLADTVWDEAILLSKNLGLDQRPLPPDSVMPSDSGAVIQEPVRWFCVREGSLTTATAVQSSEASPEGSLIPSNSEDVTPSDSEDVIPSCCEGALTTATAARSSESFPEGSITPSGSEGVIPSYSEGVIPSYCEGSLTSATAESIASLLREADLLPLRDVHPFTLSYGQKRRLNLVSVSAHQPRLLLADEALIGQDPANAVRIMTRLRALADAGACVLLALHDPRIALTYADRLLFLQRGQLRVDAAPPEALRQIVSLGHDAYGLETDG